MMGPQQAELQKLRAKQIDSLRSFFPTVKTVTPDIYEVPIQLPNRSFIKLIVTLPPDFPQTIPSLQVSPTVQHPLVSSSTSFILPTAHEHLTRWTPHVSLGKTIYEIVQKFMQQPPTIGPSNPAPAPIPSRSPIPPPTSGFQTPSGSFPPPTSLPSYPTFIPPPSYPSGNDLRTQITPPSSFPELENKSNAELQQLLNDETEFARFFESLPAVTTSKKVREDLKTSNEELAQKILAKEREVERLRGEVAARSNAAKEKRAAFDVKLQRQQEVMKQFSTPVLVEKLAEKAQAADEASEELAKQFHNGAIDHKEFIKAYMEKRRLFHLRSAKKESITMIAK